ncbi:HNH endonuclease [Agrococcus sp. HG114]|uniref:HNH endonuclease n=1 Tax=Agrococcus sp. HG114 TaxID=2969757 RepID=UPI00215A656B|nr:HNH endonuclease signature motif containing protein [Agrococcus sp. HG114]MCR8669998.1 HNH endonuclease [Agrococcus sp. HG114]
MDLAGVLLQGMLSGIAPHLPWLVPLVLLAIVLGFPMLGRGPNSTRRDPWRGFKFAARETVLERAGRQCEASLLLAWGRCGAPAVEVDHVVPWSRGGPTVVSNGQALCRAHNRAKGARVPPWWYVLGLERRRRRYFPAGADVRVLAVMGDADRAARARPPRRRATDPLGPR